MRNVFDQYSQPENRVTHALMTALNEDRVLLASFLRDVATVVPPVSSDRLQLLEQQLPGDRELPEEVLDGGGIPDGWIHDGEGWCIVIESKLTASFRPDQIARHLRTARSRGFQSASAVSLTPDSVACDGLLRSIRWRDVYSWLHQQRSKSRWADTAATYLELMETELTELGTFSRGTLTMFAGFAFSDDHPYTYLEAKRVLGLAMDELRSDTRLRALGVQPAEPGRPAIKGSNERRVWDLLPLSPPGSLFTKAPHLTMGVHEDWVEVVVTFPHAMDGIIRRRIIDLGREGFAEQVEQILRAMRPLLEAHPGIVPWFRGIQRRYVNPSIVRAVDGSLEFDLRTAVPTIGGPKYQRQWLDTAFGMFEKRDGANYQMQVGAQLRFKDCPELSEASSVGLLAEIWLACSPLITVALPELQAIAAST
ncbi:MAG: hypothetical protein ABI697_12970 [Devosia sp.]